MYQGSLVIKGKQISYRETSPQVGTDPHPALLLHRAGGSSRDWEAQLEALDGRCHLLAPDLPGHGGTTGPALASIGEMSELVVSFIEALGTKKVLLVGHSMGGAVALTTALSRPELVSGLLLVASGARLRVAQPLLKAVREQFHLLPELMARMVFSPQTPPEVVEAQRPLLFDAPAETVASDLEACDRFDAEPELGGLAVPVTVLVGSEDFLTPPRLGRRLAERAPRSRVEIVQGAGHLLPQEQPAVVSELILELLRGAGTR